MFYLEVHDWGLIGLVTRAGVSRGSAEVQMSQGVALGRVRGISKLLYSGSGVLMFSF